MKHKYFILFAFLFFVVAIIILLFKNDNWLAKESNVKVSRQVEERKKVSFKEMLDHKEYRTPKKEVLAFWAKHSGEYYSDEGDKERKISIVENNEYQDDYEVTGIVWYGLFGCNTLKIKGETAYCFDVKTAKANGYRDYQFYKFVFKGKTMKVWRGDSIDFRHMELLFKAKKHNCIERLRDLIFSRLLCD